MPIKRRVLFCFSLIMIGCNPRFPEEPENLPDCEVGQSTEFCGSRRDSSMKQIPFVLSNDTKEVPHGR